MLAHPLVFVHLNSVYGMEKSPLKSSRFFNCGIKMKDSQTAAMSTEPDLTEILTMQMIAVSRDCEGHRYHYIYHSNTQLHLCAA